VPKLTEHGWAVAELSDASGAPVKLKVIFYVVGLAAGASVVGIEIGSHALTGGGPAAAQFTTQTAHLIPGSPPIDPARVTSPPGIGISYLALVDGFLLFVLALEGLSLVVTQRTAAKLQGVITLIVSLLWLLASLFLALVAVGLLLLMLGLFLAVPFGTIVYLAKWGFFPVAGSAAILSLVLLLKLIWGGALAVANPRFLVVKGLVALFLLSLLLQAVLSILHGVLPGPVVSIGDALWAIVTAIVALVWALITFIGAIPAVVKAIHSSAELA
jgi:hypothetical protein